MTPTRRIRIKQLLGKPVYKKWFSDLYYVICKNDRIYYDLTAALAAVLGIQVTTEMFDGFCLTHNTNMENLNRYQTREVITQIILSAWEENTDAK